MKTQINEIKRMQQLAGVIKESVNENASYTVHLKIDGKTVMSRESDNNLDEKEMSDNLTALESKYKDKYDFNKAELIVLDPSGKQVGSLTKKNQKYMQWPYRGDSNFGDSGDSGFYEGKAKRMQQLAGIVNEVENTNPAVEKKIEDNVEKAINSSQAQATLQKMADQLSDEDKQRIMKFMSSVNESTAGAGEPDLEDVAKKLMALAENNGPQDSLNESTAANMLGQVVLGAPVVAMGAGLIKGILAGGAAVGLAAATPFFAAAAAGAVLIGLFKIISNRKAKANSKPQKWTDGANVISNPIRK